MSSCRWPSIEPSGMTLAPNAAAMRAIIFVRNVGLLGADVLGSALDRLGAERGPEERQAELMGNGASDLTAPAP